LFYAASPALSARAPQNRKKKQGGPRKQTRKARKICAGKAAANLPGRIHPKQDNKPAKLSFAGPNASFLGPRNAERSWGLRGGPRDRDGVRVGSATHVHGTSRKKSAPVVRNGRAGKRGHASVCGNLMSNSAQIVAFNPIGKIESQKKAGRRTVDVTRTPRPGNARKRDLLFIFKPGAGGVLYNAHSLGRRPCLQWQALSRDWSLLRGRMALIPEGKSALGLSPAAPTGPSTGPLTVGRFPSGPNRNRTLA